MKQPIPFGKYLLLERINVGGMAEIYLARSRGVHGFKRLLAIKKILPTMAEDEEFIAMFVDEARIAAELSHACIVQIFELGRFEDDYYIAMEFVHGKDMRYIQERKSREGRPVAVHLAAFIAHKICEALDYAHNKKDPTGRPLGIIHRDVSPQNVIISYEGEVKICDFGIAKAANRSQKTQAGVLKGKFGYMSPEQVRGLPLDGRSDLFTVGTLLYEMVTLERLFMGESDFSTLEKVRNADVVPPSTYNREVPEELEDIILRALTKEVEDRFQNAAEFGDALQHFILTHHMTSSRDLSEFVKKSFAVELDAELRRLEEYQNLPESRLEAGGVGGPGLVPVSSQELAEVDLDAKTLIFASSETGSSGQQLAPPPIPSSRNRSSPKPETQPAAPWNRAVSTAETAVGSPSPAIADAKTMIFSDPALQPEDDIHELPTRGSMERPDLRLVAGEGRPAAAGSGKASTRERFFIPLALFTALLLGWSIFVTFRLQQSPAGDLASEFKLITWPASGVKVSLDEKEVATVTPFMTRDIEPGIHRLRVRRNGFEEIDRKFELEPGTRFVMEVVLSKTRTKDGKRPGPRLPAPVPTPGKPEDPGQGARPGAIPDGAKPGPPVEPEKEPAPPKAAEPKPPAELEIVSDPPGAQVALNGKAIGKAPLVTQEAEPGSTARVVLSLRGYRNAVRKVPVEAGKRKTLRVAMIRSRTPPKPPKEPEPKSQHGYLVANTRPWSKVFVDGKYTGRETPIAPDKKLKLSAGKHQVVFETPGGKRYAFDVVIEPEKVLKLIKRLE